MQKAVIYFTMLQNCPTQPQQYQELKDKYLFVDDTSKVTKNQVAHMVFMFRTMHCAKCLYVLLGNFIVKT
jgi:hypothetical protein